MARRSKALVLDSWAVLAYLEDEAAGQDVANLIAETHEGGHPLYMSVVNAGEVWYILAREISEAEADRAIAQLHQLGIQFVDVAWPQTKIAATFKVKGKMSYADCFAAALAKEKKTDLLTGDKEFKQVESEIGIRWLL
ncbi:MAG: type II toxin-antitoxin system VapC family toxin [Stenotrophobium sp.]